ncbi:MAG TPA: hypothetical protein VGA84_08750 [Thermoanaerobaculia bacterium]
MGPRSALGLLLTAFASVAVADSLRFAPPVATVHTSVDAILSARPSGCGVTQEGVTVTGTTVTVRVSTIPPPSVVCGASGTQFPSTFHLGVLSAGVYDVVAVVNSFPAAHARLIVRDDSLTLPPDAVPVTGGEILVRRRSDSTGRVVVLVDGRPATFARGIAAGDVYFAPPHAAGTVDVSVASESTFHTAVAALTYFDRAAPPDPALFEIILFPTAFDGPGAFGAHWTTDNYLAPGGEPARFRDRLPCFLCSDVLTDVTSLRNDPNPAGVALFALRGMTSQLMAGSRIHDQSRQQNGTEVRVVRERDFSDRGMYFLTVPVDLRSRVMLRAWALTDVAVTIAGITPPNAMLRFVTLPGTPLAFATLDLTSYLQHLQTGTISAYIYFPRAAGLDLRMWGMISVTDNDTQQVTIISSQ